MEYCGLSGGKISAIGEGEGAKSGARECIGDFVYSRLTTGHITSQSILFDGNSRIGDFICLQSRNLNGTGRDDVIMGSPLNTASISLYGANLRAKTCKYEIDDI